MSFYINCTDYYVGPFNSQAELDAHCTWRKSIGDGDRILGTIETSSVPEGADISTPEQDRDIVYEPPLKVHKSAEQCKEFNEVNADYIASGLLEPVEPLDYCHPRKKLSPGMVEPCWDALDD